MQTPEQLLQDLGYAHPRLHAVRYEDDHVVVLFSVPHQRGRRRALTAFIATREGRPDFDVEPGFVIEQGENQ